MSFLVGWAAWTFPPVGPLAGNQIAVPAQQRRRRHEEDAPRPARQQPRERRQQHPVPIAQIGAGSPGGAARRPDAGARGSRPPWPGHRARAGSGTEGYGRGSGTGQTRTRAARMPATRACPSHEPAAQQRRSGFSHSTGSPRRRTARSLRCTVDVLLAVSVGSSASTALPVMPHPSCPTSTLRRRTRTRHRPPAPSHHRHQCSFPLLAGRSRAGDARLRATARNRAKRQRQHRRGPPSLRVYQAVAAGSKPTAHACAQNSQMWAIWVMVGLGPMAAQARGGICGQR